MAFSGALDAADLKLWGQKWRWYERNSLPWNRARIHYEFARRRAFCRWPVHGNVLEMLREGRLELGEHVLLEPNVWLTAQAPARIRIGGGTFLNLGVQVAAVELVEIGEHCMLANGCFVTDGNHRFDDPEKPVPWQGFTSKGPTRLGDNVWLGRQRRRHQRRHDRRPLRGRRQLGRHHRPAAALDRRRRRPRAPDDRVPAAGVPTGSLHGMARWAAHAHFVQHDVHADAPRWPRRRRRPPRPGPRRRARPSRCRAAPPRPSAPCRAPRTSTSSTTMTAAASDTHTTSKMSPALTTPSIAQPSAVRVRPPTARRPKIHTSRAITPSRDDHRAGRAVAEQLRHAVGHAADDGGGRRASAPRRRRCSRRRPSAPPRSASRRRRP